MQQNAVMKAYLRALEKRDLEGIVQLFGPDGIVYSPVNGSQTARPFFTQLFTQLREIQITLKNIFSCAEHPSTAAIFFRADWVLCGLKGGFECVDIFQFEKDSDKIQKLTIIYQTLA